MTARISIIGYGGEDSLNGYTGDDRETDRGLP